MGKLSEHLFADPAQAEAFVRSKRRGRVLYASVECFVPTTEGRGFSIPTNIELSMLAAAKLIHDTHSAKIAERGGHTRIGLYDNCLFIG